MQKVISRLLVAAGVIVSAIVLNAAAPSSAFAYTRVCAISHTPLATQAGGWGYDGAVWIEFTENASCTTGVHKLLALCSSGAVSIRCPASIDYRYTPEALVAWMNLFTVAKLNSWSFAYTTAPCGSNGSGTCYGQVYIQ